MPSYDKFKPWLINLVNSGKLSRNVRVHQGYYDRVHINYHAFVLWIFRGTELSIEDCFALLRGKNVNPNRAPRVTVDIAVEMLELRRQGLTWPAIGAQFGKDKKQAYQIVNRYLQKHPEEELRYAQDA